MTGIFITFEGPDGSGKTTQLQITAEKLRNSGYDVVVTREPGGTAISDHIRSILLNPNHTDIIDQAEILLYAASRAQHVHQLIIPALQQHKIVICDRYIDASVAYQGFGLGIDPQIVRMISEFASSSLHPRRTYLLDVPVHISQERIRSRASQHQQQALDRIESKTLEYHEKVRQAFLHIAATEAHRVVLLDGSKPQEHIAKEIWTDIEHLLGDHPIQR
jgi:dTMP kinase